MVVNKSKEDGGIFVWGAPGGEKSLGNGLGEKENWAIEGIGNWVTHAWHAHPVAYVTSLLDIWKTDSS